MSLAARIALGAAVILWALLIVPRGLVAGEVTTKVGKGESLSLICQKAYGDKDLYPLVALYNGKDDPEKISPGEVVRLPYSETVTLQKGDSLSILARRIWSHPEMYPVLAWANGVSNAEKVPVGTRLAVPVLIPYSLKKGESVSSIAEVFYGNPKAYEIIVNASRIENPSHVPVGTVLRIPYVMPRPVVRHKAVKAVEKPAPKAVKKPVPKAAPKPEAAKPDRDLKTEKALKLLDRADQEFRSGRYGDAWTTGNEASHSLAGKDRARALRLMAATQYAFGKTEAALDDLRRAHELDSDFVPDPAYVNPEMRELYKKASRQDAGRSTQ